jgi:uncharacterized surface protein with fasciclin (FAS1) repeats
MLRITPPVNGGKQPRQGTSLPLAGNRFLHPQAGGLRSFFCHLTQTNHNTANYHMKKSILTTLSIAALSLSPLAAQETEQNIVQVAVAADDFNTLVAAVQAAGLVETLSGEGPFTVFAPTDAAFAKLPEGTVDNLLKPENKDQLVAVLTYHVVPAKVLAADVKTGDAPTVNGQTIKIDVSDAGVKVNDANVVATDVMASNGVIHVIDTVILPE